MDGTLLTADSSSSGNSTSTTLVTAINVQSPLYGAKGDGTTDDTAAIQSAQAAAKAAGLDLYFPPGRYKTSKYIDFSNCIEMTVWGVGATIVYPSADTTLNGDSIAPNGAAERSAFCGLFAHDVTFHRLTFEGSQKNIVDLANQGSGIYARNCQRITLYRCTQRYGASLIQHDTQKCTTGTGDSIAVSGSTVTLNDAAGLFKAGHKLLRIAIWGCTHAGNNGVFTVMTVPGTTSLTIDNPNAVNETSSFTWQIEDRDMAATVQHCLQDRARFINTLPAGSKFLHNILRWPRETMDMCGVGDTLTISGTTMTLKDLEGKFTPHHHGKYVKISGATTSANNGYYGPITFVDYQTVTFANASGVSEPFPGQWWVMNGELVGVGAGTGALSLSSSTMTLTVAGTPFADAAIAAAIVNRSLVLRNPTTTANRDNNWQILTVPTSSTLTFSTTGTSAVGEDFSGVWTINDWDFTGGIGSANGSTHAVYIFAANDFAGDNGDVGRSHILIEGNQFFGNRTTCIKLSGTASPMRNIIVRNNYAQECDAFVVFGADGQQEHTGISVIGNHLVDCGPVHRRGQVGDDLITILGARNVNISDNQFYWTRDAVFRQYTSVGGLYAIQVQRYVGGISQAVNDCTIKGNKFNTVHDATSSAVLDVAIRVSGIGLTAQNNTGGSIAKQSSSITGTIAASAGTLTRSTGSWITDGYYQGGSAAMSGFTNGGNNTTKTIASMTATVLTFTSNAGLVNETHAATVSNNVVTLTDNTANFLGQRDIGKTITIVNATDSGNNGAKTITGVPSTAKVTWLDSGGVTRNPMGGTWRLPARAGLQGGPTKIFDNEILGACVSTGIEALFCNPHISRNTFQAIPLDVWLTSCWFPKVVGNDDLTIYPLTSGIGGIKPRLRIDDNNCWPIVRDNYYNAGTGGGGFGRQWDVETSGDNEQRDYPLLGHTVRMQATQGKEQFVFAYGDDSAAVDGDTITIVWSSVSHTCTWKTSSPGTNQFNSKASLLTWIASLGSGTDLTAADYGTGLSGGDVDTGHIIVSATAVSTTDGNITVTTSTMNPYFLCVLRNESSSNQKCDSRGSASAGPTPDKAVVWSPQCQYASTVVVVPANSDARTVLQANGPALRVANANNSGACEVMNVGDCTGKMPEFRAVV